MRFLILSFITLLPLAAQTRIPGNWIFEGGVNSFQDIGLANAYQISPTPAISSYDTTSNWCFLPAHSNTGASTLQFNGLGAKAIQKNGSAALAGGEIVANQPACVIYDGTQFQLWGGAGGSGSVSITGGTGITVTPSPLIGAGTIGISNIAANSVLGNSTGSTGAVGAIGLAAPSFFQNYLIAKFPHTTAPGALTGNEPLDVVVDSTNHNVYICGAVAGTAAPACATVGATSWMQFGMLANTQTWAGVNTFSGNVKFTGLSAGTQTSCLGLDASNNAVTAACGSGAVSSVFTRTGAVTAQSGDYSASQVTNAVANNSANTYSGGGLQDLSAMKLKPPTSAVAALPAASGASNQVYEVTDGATATDCTTGLGSTLVWCASNGTSWVALAGSGGGSAFNAITGGTNTTAAMLVGSGASLGFTGTGTIAANNVGFGLQMASGNIAANTSVMASNANVQSGTPLNCSSTTGTASYLCSLTPTLVSYTNGMILNFTADAASLTTCTLNVDSVGSKTLYLADGVTGCGKAINAGARYQVSYDSSLAGGLGAFKLLGSGCNVSGTTLTCQGAIQAGAPGGVGGTITLPEGTAASGSAGNDVIYGSSTLHGLRSSMNAGTDLPIPQGPASTTNGHAVGWSGTGGNLLTDAGAFNATLVGLGNVTNDAQTKAAVVPNTAPSAGQILVGNAGGTAYAPVSPSGAFTLASTGVATIASVVNPATGFQIGGAAASGHYLRGNGTNYIDGTIQAGDVPTLNQNTTGTAANLSGTPALPNGTTATSQTACDNSTKIATTASFSKVCNTVETAGSPLAATAQSQTLWNNTAGAYVVDLPTAASGIQICQGNYKVVAQVISFVPATGATIYYKGVAGTTSSATGLVSGGAAGDFICLEAVDSTTWEAIGPGQGTWTNN